MPSNLADLWEISGASGVLATPTVVGTVWAMPERRSRLLSWTARTRVLYRDTNGSVSQNARSAKVCSLESEV